MPGDSYRTLATSYDWRTDGKDGGACGYTLGGGLSLPDAVLGAAQQIEYFGNGLACGTCIKVTPLDITVKDKAEPQIVTVLNSCPGKCHSIDIESGVVENWFGERIGQFNIQADIVPCGYLSQGITIQYRQITDSPDDLRLNFRLSSGAIKLAEISSDKYGWLQLVKVNPNQYTLADYGKSKDVLSQSKFSLRFHNHKGEVVTENNVPNLVKKNGFGLWYKTNVNFKNT